MPKLIVALGNPGAKYANTRHNVGWMILDALAERHNVSVTKSGFHGLYGEMHWPDPADKVILLKPITYMNLSGRSVAPAAHFFKVSPEEILVIHDDMDLELGRLRLRPKGSSGGHNGVKSVIQELGTQEFPRLKVGIGRPDPGWDPADWVLAPFRPEEAAVIGQVIPRAVEAVESFLSEGILKAMTRYNAV